MKQVLALVVLAGVIFAGCSGEKKQPPQSQSDTQAAAPAAQAPTPAPQAAEATPDESKPAPQAEAQTAKTPPARAAARPAPVKPAEPAMVTRLVPIPTGSEIVAALDEKISTGTQQAGTAFSATLNEPFAPNGVELLPAGTKIQGAVSTSKRAPRVGGKAELSLEFTSLTTPDGKSYKLFAQPLSLEGKSTTGGDVEKLLGTAVGGAIVGGVLGGKKGAVKGGAIGGAAGAGWAVATRGNDIVLDPGSQIKVTVIKEFEVPVSQKAGQPAP